MGRGRRDWGEAVAIGAAVYAAVYALWTYVQWDFWGHNVVVNDLADYPVLVAAAVLMLRASRTVKAPRIRRGWRMLAIAYVALIVANAIYDYIDLVLDQPTFPSVGDLFFSVFPPFVLVGLLSFPERLGRRRRVAPG